MEITTQILKKSVSITYRAMVIFGVESVLSFLRKRILW